MSSTISHISFIRGKPQVILTTLGRVKVTHDDGPTIVYDLDDARVLLVQLESALLRLSAQQAYAAGESSRTS
jgi:hypothetical protein